MRICIVRHGQTDWNKERKIQGRTDIFLNDTGREQARLCAKYLTMEPFDLIVTSPLSRALETAKIIQSKLNIPLVTMPQFIEKKYGEIEGLTFEEREQLVVSGVEITTESMEEVTSRITDGLQLLQEKYRGKDIILVSHGGLINVILKILSNGEIGTGKTKLENACITRIYLEEKDFKIASYNEINHLMNVF